MLADAGFARIDVTLGDVMNFYVARREPERQRVLNSVRPLRSRPCTLPRPTMIYRFGAYELDEDAGELRHRGESVPIQPKPFELLRILLRERDRIVAADELFDALWPGLAVTPGSLTRAVSVARRAIGDGHRGELLRSVARRGYRFTGDVVVAPAPGLRAGEPGAAPRPAAAHAPQASSSAARRSAPLPRGLRRKRLRARARSCS
jgi:DNA-binding winged helix-turn-helix (wHTH) protein